MSQTASDTYDLSLQRLILEFMKYAHDNGETSFPPFECNLWHEFLYLLKSDFEKKFPELECIGAFDWDIIFPKCREFSVAMFTIRYQCYSKFPGGRVFLNQEIKTHSENPLEKYYPELAEKMLYLAHKMPGFFEKNIPA